MELPAPYYPLAGELEGSALPSNETITTEFCRALPDRLLGARLRPGFRRVRGQGERVNGSTHGVPERGVDEPVLLDPTLAGEGARDDARLVVILGNGEI